MAGFNALIKGEVLGKRRLRALQHFLLEYVRQVQDLEKEHREAGTKLTGDAFLSGILPEDHLCPVITTIF